MSIQWVILFKVYAKTSVWFKLKIQLKFAKTVSAYGLQNNGYLQTNYHSRLLYSKWRSRQALRHAEQNEWRERGMKGILYKKTVETKNG